MNSLSNSQFNDTEPQTIVAQTITDRVRDLLRDGQPRTRSDIANALGDVENEQVSKALYSLRMQGHVQRDDNSVGAQKLYRIAKTAPPPQPIVPARPKPMACPPLPTTTVPLVNPQTKDPDVMNAQPIAEPARSYASLLKAKTQPGFSIKAITTVNDVYNALARAVLSAVLEGHAAHPTTERLALAASSVEGVLVEMRGSGPITGASLDD